MTLKKEISQCRKNFLGLAIPFLITDPLVVDCLRDYAKSALANQYDLIEGAFHFIVDTGCSVTSSPCQDDFEVLYDLPKPITLHGIAGNSQVTRGGILCFECVNMRGEIVQIKCFGYHDPNLHVCLFSPQAYFCHCPKQEGMFQIQWSKTFLELDNGRKVNGKIVKDILPCIIDKGSSMPTCFHNVDKVAAKLGANNNIIDIDSDNLTATQRQLLCFHYKLGHLGFKYLRWVLASGLFGPLKIRCSKKDVIAPPCQACLQGGQQRNPAAGNIHKQVNKDSTKREQLIPGQRIFSDQYVSSTPGRNYNGRGKTQSPLTYKAGTVFADADSSYLFLHHQLALRQQSLR